MSYLDATTLHALPVKFGASESEPASILFPQGPQWARRYQINQEFDRLNDCFMYTDQGPPMYRLLGAHYNMYKIPTRTDYHTPARSYHYEARQYSCPNKINGAVTFPGGPPPPQVSLRDGLVSVSKSRDSKLEESGQSTRNLKVWDRYRYLPGPPS